VGFTAGLYATASSTIGNGTQQGGLTVWGGATTTGNAYFANSIGIGTTSPLAKLSIQANAGETNSYLFAVGSSTGAFATTTLFTIDNTGTVNFGGGTNIANTGVLNLNGHTIASAGLISGGTLVLTGAATTTGTGYFINRVGVGTTTPYALSSIHTNNGSTNTTLFAIGSSTQTATTTLFSVSNTGAASTTQLFGAGLASCNGGSNALTWNAGTFGCNSISAGAGTFPFTPTAYGVSTSTIVGFTNGLISAASSTFSGGLTVANGLNVSSSATITNPSISANTNFLTLDATTINNVNQEERIFFQNGPTLPLGYMGVGEENPAGSYMAFGTVNTLSAAATEKLRISAVGNIGISSSSPWAQLSVNPDGLTGPAFAIGSTTRTLFSVSTAGKVGINMSVPNANFQVHTTGNVATVAKLSNSVTGSGSQDGVDWALLPGGTDAQIWNYENGYLRFGTNNTEVGLFDSLGDFGIGSSSPFARLSIASNNALKFPLPKLLAPQR
jgi:hypothetical protein